MEDEKLEEIKTGPDISMPEQSDWKCELFGSKNGNGMVYTPAKGAEPNRYIRFMMKIMLGCTWVKG